ncbi:MAG: hypothetical protein UT32_C0001G0015 [Parcubacteria group bacterium GW2011_GWC2_39_14]|nr:MAG: hypothetical protein UT32_C0001G0015 [Parcubacteria group bacterium GW2011_GWC2_39_14]KKR55439.1 MAG: hypothetical protein UT91_C0001G0014 [Parcubacteria group bacterium GW2011_GWA2_40_23]
MKKHLGQNLIEAIIAIGIFGILIAGGVMTGLHYFDSQIRAQAQSNLAQLANNSFEILDGLAKTNWNSLALGTHGLILNSNNWEISGTPDLIDQTTRTINITSGLRDGNCNLVDVGGTADTDTKLITITFTYNDNRGLQSKTFSQYFTNWAAPTNCLVQTEAGNLNLDVSTAFIDSTKKSLFGIYLRNLGNTVITLDKMTFTWNTEGDITYVKINGANYWHSTNGIGTPQGEQPSGTELDLVNFVLQPLTSYQIDNVRFDDKVDGATFTIKATMLDNSSKTEFTTPPFIP